MTKHKILVVEDNSINMELVTDLLMVAGYDVLQAENAGQAIGQAKSQIPDLILMDINLPGVDGLAATRTLKQDPATARIPVVALTAYAMPDDKEKVLAAGCTAYIAKPIDTRLLTQIVAHVIGEAE